LLRFRSAFGLFLILYTSTIALIIDRQRILSSSNKKANLSPRVRPFG
jgi:hypothetical protein